MLSKIFFLLYNGIFCSIFRSSVKRVGKINEPSSDKILIYRGEFSLGYWHFSKRRGSKPEKIGIPIPFAPNSNIQECYFYEVEKNKIENYIKVIDPKDFSFTEIKKICEYNNISFFWVTGISQFNRQKINFTEIDPISKAIDFFIMLFAENTVSQYERCFLEMVDNQIINPNISISDYKKNQSDIIKNILNRYSKTEELKFKYYYILISFHNFLKEPLFFKKIHSDHNYKSKRQNHLSESEVNIFLSNLKKINPLHELIAQIIWHINHSIGKGKLLFTLDSILRMRTEDFHPQKKMITIYYHKLIKHCFTAVDVPDHICSRLIELITPEEIFIFRNKYGAPIDSGQLRKSFLKASIQSDLNHITPSCLL